VLSGDEMRNITDILVSLIKLDGEKTIDKLYVYRAKFFFLLYIFLVPVFGLSKIHMGLFLTRDVVAKNSYGKFYCRKKDEDLHLVSEHYENKTLFVFKI